MKLFEGGILDKITSDEYEKMFQMMPVDAESDEKVSGEQEEKVDAKLNGRQSTNTKAKISSEKELTALNLRTLQGAFYLVLMGHFIATVTLILEIERLRASRKIVKKMKNIFRSLWRLAAQNVLRWFHAFMQL